MIFGPRFVCVCVGLCARARRRSYAKGAQVIIDQGNSTLELIGTPDEVGSDWVYCVRVANSKHAHIYDDSQYFYVRCASFSRRDKGRRGGSFVFVRGEESDAGISRRGQTCSLSNLPTVPLSRSLSHRTGPASLSPPSRPAPQARHFLVTWAGQSWLVRFVFYSLFTSHVEVAATLVCDARCRR